jgi:Uma2 family endonuclease
MAQPTIMIGEDREHSLPLNLQSLRLNDEQFQDLCTDNPDLRFELTAEGELIIMPPTGSMTGWRNSKLSARLFIWAEADGTGICFDSSTLFSLPNGAKRSPDASWVRLERWNRLTEDEKEGIAPVCPNFVADLRSPTDSLSTLQDKMIEYIENGAQLGWLIDPKNKRIYIYRPNQTAEVLENPDSVSGEPVLKGFVLNLSEIW